MPLKIFSVGGLAEKHNIKANHMLISINNNKINDFIDLQFYSSDQTLELVLLDENKNEYKVTIEQDWINPLGVEPVEHKIRCCANNCIFCFIDQMHPNLRKSLYVKDDDYLMSFVWGNFITLTNLSEKDFNRIIEQQLSPLYVSVHTTNAVLHKQMLRYKHSFNLLQRLKFLSSNGIDIHTQLVIVPGFNDGNELKKSLTDLTNPELNILSVGVVPVGLTKFRKDLNTLSNVSKTDAFSIVQITNEFTENDAGCIVNCSDELFLKAELEVPSADYYDDFSQIENGIGMVRQMLDNFDANLDMYVDYVKSINQKQVIYCGTLIYNTFKPLIEKVNKVIGEELLFLKAVENKFFGKEVTVTGLLTAVDIIAVHKNEFAGFVPHICNSIFNHQGYTLDEQSKDDLIKSLGGKVIITDEFFETWELIYGEDK